MSFSRLDNVPNVSQLFLIRFQAEDTTGGPGWRVRGGVREYRALSSLAKHSISVVGPELVERVYTMLEDARAGNDIEE